MGHEGFLVLLLIGLFAIATVYIAYLVAVVLAAKHGTGLSRPKKVGIGISLYRELYTCAHHC